MLELLTQELQIVTGPTILRWPLDGSHAEQLQQDLAQFYKLSVKNPKDYQELKLAQSQRQAFFGLSWMLLGISHREWPLYAC